MYHEYMDIVKLGKSGQVALPRALTRRLGLEQGTLFLVDVGDEGEIVLRPAGVYPIEIYSHDRIAAFLDEDRLSEKERAKLGSRRRK